MSFDEKNIPSPFESSLNHFLSDDDKKTKFIGEKYEKYYKEKFERITPKKQMAGFHIAAFILGPIWLFYRKMYAYGFIYIAFMIIYGIFADFVEISDSTDRAISIAVAVTLGLSGNGLYKNFVDKKLTTSVRGIEEAQEQGGTNPVLAWSLFVLIILLIGVGIFYGG